MYSESKVSVIIVFALAQGAMSPVTGLFFFLSFFFFFTVWQWTVFSVAFRRRCTLESKVS